MTGAAELIERARQLAPALRERAVEAEALRRCPDQTIADLQETQLLRVMQPKIFGGFELGWDVHCEICMELSRGCGAQGWIGGIFNDHKYVLALFPEQAQRDVWDADRDALIAASFAPQGKARAVDGGYLVNGRFGFSSGIHHAGWVLAGAMTEHEPGGDPEHCYFLLPEQDVTRIDNWHVLGLAGTGSQDFEVHDAFVPEHRVLAMRLAQQGTAPGTLLHKGVVYRMPQKSIAGLGLASPPVGIAEWVLEEFIAAARVRVSRGGRVGEWQSTQLRIAESSAEIAAARLLVLDVSRRAMETLETRPLTVEERATAKRNSCFAAMLSRRAVDRLFDGAGGHALYLDSPLQRGMRDAKAAASHFALGWDVGGTTYGRVALGLEPLEGLL